MYIKAMNDFILDNVHQYWTREFPNSNQVLGGLDGWKGGSVRVCSKTVNYRFSYYFTVYCSKFIISNGQKHDFELSLV